MIYMERYRKAVAAIVTLVILFIYRRWAVDLHGTEAQWIEIIMITGEAILTWVVAHTVWNVENKPVSGATASEVQRSDWWWKIGMWVAAALIVIVGLLLAWSWMPDHLSWGEAGEVLVDEVTEPDQE